MPTIKAQQLTLIHTQGLEIVGQGYEHPDDQSWLGTDVITHSFGIGLDIGLSPNFSLVPSIHNSLYEYIYIESLDRAFPTISESAGIYGSIARMWELGISLPARFSIHFSEETRMFLGPVLATMFYIPVILIDGTSDGSPISSALAKEGRWFYGGMELGMNFRANQRFNFGLGLEFLFPFYKLASQEPGLAHDRMIIRALLHLRLKT